MSRRACVFILTHGRPDNVLTARALERYGYTGDWYIVLDDLDPTIDRYVDRFGPERVIVFDKVAQAQTFDTADLSTDYRAVVFARNAAFQIARERGYTHFVEMDDDYNHFEHKFEKDDRLGWCKVRDLDAVFAAMFDFLDDSGADAVAFSQGGDFIGGHLSANWQRGYTRKVMNAIFCRADADWRFLGRVNEDVNTYTTLATRGRLFISTVQVMLSQEDTQSQPGGMTELYLSEGTYQKSMYSVMMCPSAVRVTAMGETRPRLHHQVQWRNCTPMILAEEYRKP